MGVGGLSNGLSSIDGSMVDKSSPDKTIGHRKHSGCCRSGGLIPDKPHQTLDREISSVHSCPRC